MARGAMRTTVKSCRRVQTPRNTRHTTSRRCVVSARATVQKRHASEHVASDNDSNTKIGQAAAGTALAAIIAAGVPATVAIEPAQAGALVPCKTSKAFAKREKNEIKALQKRLKLYEADSAPALAIEKSIEQTKRRFAMYGNQGLMCGADGLPHLVTTGDWKHAGEFTLPGIGFLYFAGLIGWAGRSYLIKSRSAKKPADLEILIDVPVALECFGEAASWPLKAFNELKSGELTESDDKITVSPR